jgi:hypothetical protein
MDTAQFDSEQAVQKFEPSKSRYFLWLAGGATLGILMAVALLYITYGEVLSSIWGVAIAMAVVFLLRTVVTWRNFIVAITNDTISGPSASGWNRASFELAHIDESRTGRQGLLDKIDGTRRIHSTDGKTIVLSGSAVELSTSISREKDRV